MRKLTGLLVLALVVSLLAPISGVSGEQEIVTIRMSSEIPYTFDIQNDALAKMIYDKFGILFESVDYEGSYETMMLDALSGTMADVVYTEPLYDLYGFSNMIDSEYFRTVPDELLAKYPTLQAQVEASEVCGAVREHFGGNYILPKVDCLDPTIYVSERKGIYVRQDWLDKLGLEIPTTWEELYEVAKAFTEQDPDGNGVADTYGLTGDTIGNMRYFFSALGHTNMNWVKQEDGTWIHGALMDDNVVCLEWLRKMYEGGYIDPEMGSTKWEQAVAKFASGTFGMVIRNADADWLNNVIVKGFYEANPDKGNPFEFISLIPALSLAKEDLPAMDKYIDTMCAVQFNADLSDELLDRYLAFHEWSMSEEGQLCAMGLEGIDWERTADNKIVKLVDADGNKPNLAEKYPSLAVTYMPTWRFLLAADPDVEYFVKFNDEIKAANLEYAAIRNQNPIASDMRVKLISAQSMLDANAFKFTAEYWNVIISDKPVAEAFAEMKARAMQDGFEQAIQEVNAICQEKGW